MKTAEREAAWLTETVLMLVARVEIWSVETTRAALAELRRHANADPDPTTGGGLLRICDALEGVAEDR